MAARKVVRKQKYSVRKKLIYVVIGIFIWTLISFALTEIAVEQFQNQKNYLILAGWVIGIIMGYVVLLYFLGVRRKKKEEDEDVDEERDEEAPAN